MSAQDYDVVWPRAERRMQHDPLVLKVLERLQGWGERGRGCAPPGIAVSWRAARTRRGKEAAVTCATRSMAEPKRLYSA